MVAIGRLHTDFAGNAAETPFLMASVKHTETIS
jgi:hypothetical protein